MTFFCSIKAILKQFSNYYTQFCFFGRKKWKNSTINLFLELCRSFFQTLTLIVFRFDLLLIWTFFYHKNTPNIHFWYKNWKNGLLFITFDHTQIINLEQKIKFFYNRHFILFSLVRVWLPPPRPAPSPPPWISKYMLWLT